MVTGNQIPWYIHPLTQCSLVKGLVTKYHHLQHLVSLMESTHVQQYHQINDHPLWQHHFLHHTIHNRSHHSHFHVQIEGSVAIDHLPLYFAQNYHTCLPLLQLHNSLLHSIHVPLRKKIETLTF
ncbi:hypothetical protein RchiOBHm_Chr5g0033961 [Rosa chinensis]|uniref:Uncharacterized protein n=1 Tax=Rosa chinensis TaxID=74649 RepID=A0A2P6QAV0_ROSCH|nr:hypothetical protein RchiOBHm_Chr5g0033961 [Rosa chinensis]